MTVANATLAWLRAELMMANKSSTKSVSRVCSFKPIVISWKAGGSMTGTADGLFTAAFLKFFFIICYLASACWPCLQLCCLPTLYTTIWFLSDHILSRPKAAVVQISQHTSKGLHTSRTPRPTMQDHHSWRNAYAFLRSTWFVLWLTRLNSCRGLDGGNHNWPCMCAPTLATQYGDQLQGERVHLLCVGKP